MNPKTLLMALCALSLWLVAGAVPVAGAPAAASATYFLTPEVQVSLTLSPDVDDHVPAIAYNSKHREYLVAWHHMLANGNRAVFTRRVTHDGTPIGYPHWIPYEWYPCFLPAIAYDATDDQYLVVWMVDADGKKYEIWGQLLHGDTGEPVAPIFRIFTWSNRQFWTPRVVWNSQQDRFLVLWNAFDATTNLPTDVAVVNVSSGGVPEAGARIVTTNQSPHEADLAYNATTGQYLVVWRRMFTVSDWDIWGALLDANGNVIGGEWSINLENVDSQAPRVATSGQHYWVAWQHWSGAQWDIVGQVLNANGTALIGPFPIAATTYSATAPAVAAAPGGAEDFLTAFQQVTPTGIALRARRDRLVGDVLKAALDQLEVAPGGFWTNELPAVAAAPDGYFIAYEGDSTSDPTVFRHIYGRAWWAAAIYLPLIRR